MSDEEITPELRRALAELPRERDPGRLLEERTVRALRAQGALAPEATQRIRFPAAWMAGAAAASLVLFGGGVVLGHQMAARSTSVVIESIQAANARQAALMVQQTGTAYAAALAQLQQAGTGQTPEQRQQGREVAVQAFRAAANELVRLAPDDPVASEVLAGFDRVRTAQGGRDTGSRKPEVVWY